MQIKHLFFQFDDVTTTINVLVLVATGNSEYDSCRYKCKISQSDLPDHCCFHCRLVGLVTGC